MPDDLLIVNDTRDAGYSYTPFFSKFDREITESLASFFMNPERFGLVVFTGGSDVMPELYSETSPKGICYCDQARDRQEVKVFNVAKNNNIPMFGICRGLQFINVMAGGKLIHDLTGHQSPHTVNTSEIGISFVVNSLHHQACIPPIDAEVLAWSTDKKSRVYVGDNDEVFNYRGPEIEAVYYPNCRAAGVQWHPEAYIGKNPTPQACTWAYLLARDLRNCKTDAIRRLYYINRPRINYVKLC